SSKIAGAEGSGVVVTALDPNSVAADHGFQVGDVILDVGGKSVTNPADVRKQLADARKEGKHALLFRVKSSEGMRFVALPLGNA
ncbi:MAG: PDZ domain-containing protein, partial [Xanthobacteraceae bacterium]